FFLSKPPTPPAFSTLSLPAALPISLPAGTSARERPGAIPVLTLRRCAQRSPRWHGRASRRSNRSATPARWSRPHILEELTPPQLDRKSTRLNSSHVSISYAVFCLKK